MGPTFDESLHDVLVTLAMIALWGGAIAVLVARFHRTRPGFAIAPAAALAFVLRVIAAGLISLTPVAQTLRGGDEFIFMDRADLVAGSPAGSEEWTHALLHELHVLVLAVQRELFTAPEMALRVTQVGIAVLGLILLAAAVYELAGARASRLAMWLLALEPASLFFSSLLHKEANILLAIGLVGYGGTMIWKRQETRYLLPVAVGCLIAVATRHYAGWFLIAAGAAIVFHAGLRAEHKAGVRSLGLVSFVVLFAAVATPTVLSASTHESLQKNLQHSQEANSSDNSNLKLESVDFSTRGAIVRNLPRRSFDVLVQPFPWELGNISQGLGLLGTTSAYLSLFFLIRFGLRRRGEIMARAGPLVYLAAFLLVAYSLSSGNAGTAFRYRVQIVSMFICIIAALWRPAESASRAEPMEDRGRAALAGGPRPPGSAPADLPAFGR
jgi:hypothetical protein